MGIFTNRKKEEHLVDIIKRKDARHDYNKVGERLIDLRNKFVENMEEKKNLESALKSNDYNKVLQKLAEEIQSLQYWNTLNFRKEYTPLIKAANQIRESLTNFRGSILDKSFDKDKVVKQFEDKISSAKDILSQADKLITNDIINDKLKEESDKKAA